jgi:hypothetical protein
VFGEDTVSAERALAPLASATLRQLLLSQGSAATPEAGIQQQPQQQQQQEEVAKGDVTAAAEDAATVADTDGVGRHTPPSSKSMQLVPTHAAIAAESSSSSNSTSPSVNAAESDSAAIAAAGADAKEQLALGEMLCDLLDNLHSQLVLNADYAAATSDPAIGVIREGIQEGSDEQGSGNEQHHHQEKARRWWREQPLKQLLHSSTSSSAADAAKVQELQLQLVAAAGKRLATELAGGLVPGALCCIGMPAQELHALHWTLKLTAFRI